MNKPMIRIHDITTGEIIDREMNEEELEQLQISVQSHAHVMAEMEAKENARLSALNKLQDLGLTEEEAKAFLG